MLRRVVGDSMLPTLEPGQIVIGVKPRQIRAGQIVIINHGGHQKIKRLTELSPAQIKVLGDNPKSSTDSRNFGWLPRSSVVARVVWPRSENL